VGLEAQKATWNRIQTLLDEVATAGGQVVRIDESIEGQEEKRLGLTRTSMRDCWSGG
jgi:hypothetical protein